jgi:hypothetical protein
VIMKSETTLLSLAIKSVSFGLVFWNSSGLLVSIWVGIRSGDPTLLHDAVERLYWQLLRTFFDRECMSDDGRLWLVASDLRENPAITRASWSLRTAPGPEEVRRVTKERTELSR